VASRPSGIDIVNDGEMSKPSYATYIKDRLDGFGGSGNTFVYQDLEQFRISPRAFSVTPDAPAQRLLLAMARSACATAMRQKSMSRISRRRWRGRARVMLS